MQYAVGPASPRMEPIPEEMDVSLSRVGGRMAGSSSRTLESDSDSDSIISVGTERDSGQPQEAGPSRSSSGVECEASCSAEGQDTSSGRDSPSGRDAWSLYEELEGPILMEDLGGDVAVVDTWREFSIRAFSSGDPSLQARALYVLEETAYEVRTGAEYKSLEDDALDAAIDEADEVRRGAFAVAAEARIREMEREAEREKALLAEAGDQISELKKEVATLKAAVGYLKGRTKELDREMGTLRSAEASPSSSPGSGMAISPPRSRPLPVRPLRGRSGGG